MKVIKIDKCFTCPKRAWNKNYDDICSVTKHELEELSQIPDDCPLEDCTIELFEVLERHIKFGDVLKRFKDGKFVISGLDGIAGEGNTVLELLNKIKEKK